jgi:exonuclease SbcC
MRPLRLKLQGLRSYREEQEVDFEDASLIAVLGDTGAGKSSLLEAITVALYGTSTWDARETKQLISDGAQTMLVSLTFRADGKVWRVERAVSRGTYPPARHSLECLDTGERLDKKDAVDKRAQQLVGLDYEAFLRSVVLPQGRFAALLQAKPSERASILKGILRIDRLDTVREEARDARERMLPVEAGLRERRARLLPDPAAAERDAEQRISAAATQRDAARSAREKVASARERARAATDRKRLLENLLSRAAEGRVQGASETLRALAEKDAEIEAALARSEAALAHKRGEEEELAATIEEAEQKGAGPVALANAKNGLALLSAELPLLAEDAAGIEKEEAALAKETAALEQATGMLATFTTAESEAKAAHAEAKAAAARAAETLQTARGLLKELRAAQNDEARTAKKVEKARADLDKAKEQLGEGESEAKKAEEKLAEADKAARAAAQKHAAAHLAAGSKPGEPCPVCERPLPDGFAPPRAPAAETAQKKLEKARGDAEKAREKLAVFRSRAESAAEKVTEATAELTERAHHVAEVTKTLSAALPGAPRELPAEDTAILSTLAAAGESAARALTEAETRALTTRDVLTRAKAELDAARKRGKERADALKKTKDALAARRKRLDDTVAKMPVDLRPRPPYQPADIAALTARVELRKLKIEKVVADLQETRGARRVLEEERSALSTRRQREVVSRVGDLDVRLATLFERLSLLAEALPAEPPAPRPETASLTDLAGWAAAFESAAATLAADGEVAAHAAARDAEAAHEEARQSLAAAGADTEAALDSALSRAEGQLAAAASDLDRARAEKPLAAALDERIERAQGLIASLAEVTRLVADGKLVGHVVHRRQRVLLSVASELLGSMTRSRYGFSEDFDVVDRVSGQARGTRTLSGGETFLASLALSLALVELAGRAGGRLEALFLDEGFGSLDAGSLGEALDALTQKAEGGRLVAVISHLRSVAESIDRVLAVRMTPTGSRVTWVSAEEREKMLSEDVERGLVS